MRALLLVLLLAGCASAPTTTSVAVGVPCKIQSVDKPKTPLQDASPDEDAFTKVKKALAEIEFRKAYEELLEAAVKSCQ